MRLSGTQTAFTMMTAETERSDARVPRQATAAA
jgi:hypothetical protein